MLTNPNAQTGTSYTFTSADTTRVTTFSNASAVAVTLPNGATFGFGIGTMLSVVNLGAGTVTITCSSCTINGAATLALGQNQGADIYGGVGSPAVNYAALPSPSGTGFVTLSGNNAQTGSNSHSGTENFTTAIFGGKPWIDPTSSTYGAKCDGVTDDFTALQAAFNAITSVGATIFVPGVCTFGTAITIPTTGLAPGGGQYGGINVVGQDSRTSVLKYTGTSGNVLSATMASGSAAWDLEFRNVGITDDQAGFNGNLLFTQNINGVVLDNDYFACQNDTTSTNSCTVDLKGEVGVTFTFAEQVNNSYFSGANLLLDGIDDSRVYGGQMYPQVGTSGGRTFAIKFNNADIQIDGVHIGTPNNNTAGAIWASTASAIGARIQNDFFDTDSPAGPHNGTGIFADGNVSAWQVSSNTFNNPGNCIFMSAAVIESEFNGNIFTLCGQGASNAGGFSTIAFGSGTCAGNLIANNQFIGTNSLTSKNAAIAEGGACSGVYGPNSITGVGTGYLAKPIAFNAGSSSFSLPWIGISEATASNLALGGNWGTSPPAPTLSQGGDRAGSIIVSSGTGTPGANPTVTLTFIAGLWPSAPLCLPFRNDNNAPSTAVWFVSTTTTSATFTFVGTPAASSTYTLVFHCGFNTP